MYVHKRRVLIIRGSIKGRIDRADTNRSNSNREDSINLNCRYYQCCSWSNISPHKWVVWCLFVGKPCTSAMLIKEERKEKNGWVHLQKICSLMRGICGLMRKICCLLQKTYIYNKGCNKTICMLCNGSQDSKNDLTWPIPETIWKAT